MKRSHAPIFWALFGAGGMVCALFGPSLVFISGVASPLQWSGFGQLFNYSNAVRFIHHPLGATGVMLLISLLAWHAAHRILCVLHDLGFRKGIAAKLGCYGFAMLLTVISASLLFGSPG